MSRLFTLSFSHIILFIGISIMVVPVWMIFASSTHTSSMINMNGLQMFLGDSFYENYLRVLLYQGGFFKEITALKMFLNSFIMATGVAILSVVTSLMAAYALVYYRIKHATLLFWIIFITILVPLELRIFPTYSVMAELNLVNSYFGLIVPISASAIATLFFRQFYKTVPDELLESAKLDGANSWRFFVDFLVPLSKTMIAAMFIFMFVYGYSQYLWPLIMTTSEKYWTVVMGMKIIFTESYEGVALPRTAERFAYIILSMLPPVLVVVILQKWFIKGLIQTEK